MTISTLDGLIAGLQPPVDLLKIGATMEAAGVLHSLFYASGTPGAAAAPTPGINGAALTTYAGQVPFNNPGAGSAYLAQLSACATVAGKLIVADRLWHNSGITITTTTEQAITSGALPARDRDGSTNGVGVMVGIEVSGATGNGSPVTNTTLNYTNSAGTAAKTGTMASFPTSANAGTFVPFQLAAGDVGIRSIQGVTLGTSYVSGTIHLVSYRVLAELPCLLANVGDSADFARLGLPKLYNNTVPFLLWLPTSTTAINLTGLLTYAHG